MNSNVLIHGRTVDNARIAIRCDELGYIDSQTIINDGNGNFLKVNSDGSLNVDSSPSLLPPNTNVLLNSDACIALQADSKPLASKDPQNNRKGWYYVNDNPAHDINLKMNWFYFDGSNSNYIVKDIKQLLAVLSMDNIYGWPFFVVYTKPTGVNDHIPGFAHSSRVYQTLEQPVTGQKFQLYYSVDNYKPVNNDNLLQLPCAIGQTDGEWSDDMPLAYITIQTDSSYSVGECKNLYEQLGFTLNDSDPLLDSDRNTVLINLDTPLSSGSSNVNANIVSSVPLDVVNTQLSKLGFNDSGSLKVIQTNNASSKTFVDADFSSLNSGGATIGVNITSSNVQAVFGVAAISGMGLGVSLLIEYSVDNVNWYSSQTSLYMNNGLSFGASYQLASTFIRFVLGGTVDHITLNFCMK